MNIRNTGMTREKIRKKRMVYQAETEQEYPGYQAENEKLETLVLIFAGLRLFYSLFYIFMSYLYEFEGTHGWILLAGVCFFLFWYNLMIRSGKSIAVMMLTLRGVGISFAGSSILEVSPWMPLPLIFTLTVSIVLEFVEAIFCIYILFQPNAAQTIRLNQEIEQKIKSENQAENEEENEKSA